MRYFHRTHVPLDDAVAEAERYFGPRLEQTAAEGRRRTFEGTIGKVQVSVQAEGGHYTLVTVTTDQVGESELDKLAKRFLSTLHTKVHGDHEVRGAY
jgi:hypothetical protein